MVDPRLPGGPPEPPESGGGDIWVEDDGCSLISGSGNVVSEIGADGSGRAARAEVGDRESDFERVRDAIAAVSISWRRRRSLPKSRCNTVIARSLKQVSGELMAVVRTRTR